MQIRVTKLRASDGTVLGTFAVGTQPMGVAFDGANIWVTNDVSNTVTKLRASDGTVLGTFGVGNHPLGVAFDGANIWVTIGGNDTCDQDAGERRQSAWHLLRGWIPYAWPLTEPTSG